MRQSLIRDGWEISRCVTARQAKMNRSVRYGIAQHMAKSVGLFLGLNQSRLPLALKRHEGTFWYLAQPKTEKIVLRIGV